MNIINKIELKGSKEDVQELINSYSTYIPPSKNYRIVDRNGKKVICVMNDKDRLEYYPLEKRFGEIPESFILPNVEGHNYFPDFDKIIPEPEEFQRASTDDDDLLSDMEKPYIKWRLENWGTYQSSYNNETISETEYLFTTDYCIPDLINLMSLSHPKVTIIYEHSSEDYIGQECGNYVFHNGELHKEIFENDSIQAKGLTYKLIPEHLEE